MSILYKSVPDKEKIYSRQVSAPILKRKTSRFGLGQFLGSNSGASQTCTSYSYPTTSNTLTHRAAYSTHIATHSVTSTHSYHSQLPPPPPPPLHPPTQPTHVSATTSLSHPLCPIHYHQHPYQTSATSSNFHNYPATQQQHFFFPPSTSHQYSSSAPVATTSTLASTHSQSHQYLLHCVAPSQTLIHSPMPTLQEADHYKQQQTKSQPSTQSHQYPHASTHSYHAHFQKHPSAPNLLPPPPPAPAPSPSPSASAIPMSCTCDVGCTPASTSASAPAPQGRL